MPELNTKMSYYVFIHRFVLIGYGPYGTDPRVAAGLPG